MNHLAIETKSILLDKLIKDYDLHSKDVAEAVELYYDAQKLRIMHANKERSEGPGELVSWFAFWLELGEKVLASKLQKWVKGDQAPAEAKWAIQQIGIGPIIAAGLAAHIDVTKAGSISALWKFAGLAPGFDHKTKGTKLPYNSRLKTLCWKLGESFVKFSGKDGAVYGKLYTQFKSDEISRNENGLYKSAAQAQLASKKFKTDNATKLRLLEGKLSDGHLHARAKRRAVKIFLSHYWTVAREARSLPLREPYAIAILKHDGKIEARVVEEPMLSERAGSPEKTTIRKRASHGE